MRSEVHSMLSQFPGEIRNQIYACLFTSTRLTFGERRISRSRRETIKPTPNSLAILHTYHHIRQEPILA